MRERGDSVTDPGWGTVVGAVRELTGERCEELMSSMSVGRIAFCRPDGAHIYPVNYRYRGGVLLIQTSAEGPLSVLAAGVDGVAFEVDHQGDLSETGWSVVARGRVEGVADPERDVPPEQLPRPWAAGTRTLVLRLVPQTLTGRAVQRG